MEMMDSTIIATSLPAIAADIGAEPIALKLAMTSYLVALAIFIPVSGWMADRFGARTVFRWAILVFMLGSLACAVSNSLPAFVGARFLQGMGGAIMSPLARLVLVRATPRENLVSAMAWLTVPALTGPMLGPPVGGFLTTFLSWHWIFLVNIPIGAAGILAATIYLPRTGFRSERSIDWRGFVLAGLCFAGLLFGISVISLPALPLAVGVATLLAGALSGWGYMLHARRTNEPLLDPRLFRHRLFRIAINGSFIFRIGVGATPFLFPLMVQLGFGLTPFETGLILLFSALGAILAKFTARPIFAGFGFRPLLLAATVLSAGVLVMFGTFTPMTPVWVMIGMMLFSGYVRSTYFSGINAMAFGDVPSEEAGQATAIFSVSTQLSLALGVAAAGGILEFIGWLRGGHLLNSDYATAFFVVAGLCVLALIPMMRLQRGEGGEISGHFSEVPDDQPLPPGK